jgi:hypothetical protein
VPILFGQAVWSGERVVFELIEAEMAGS